MSTGVKTHRITDPNDDTRFVDVDPYVVEGISRGWANFNQSSNNNINNSMNFSSFTDNSTGDSDLNYTNGPESSLYAASASVDPTSAAAVSYLAGTGITGTSILNVFTESSEGTRNDRDEVKATAHPGQLA